MFIDIHVHVRKIPGPMRRGRPAYATPQQLIERYDAIGVEQAVGGTSSERCPPGMPLCAAVERRDP